MNKIELLYAYNKLKKIPIKNNYCKNCKNCNYCDNCDNCGNCVLCVNLKNKCEKLYWALNKEVTEEEFNEIRKTLKRK